MIKINNEIQASDLAPKLKALWEASASKIDAIDKGFDTDLGAPVFTVAGKYTARGWTEWTQGFQYGSAILQYDATGEDMFLEQGRTGTETVMAPHVSHFGVHDHGFNNVSTYGNLLRLMNEGKIPEDRGQRLFYELALEVSGAVQARRWSELPDDRGYVYSFNGPHSLFADTIRSMRALAVSHALGHVLSHENDVKTSLLKRALQHAKTTADFNVYYGEGRDVYDIRGRTVHEAIFNMNDGNFRCPSTQQGYTPFTTWTRGLAWVMVGMPEQLEYLETRSDEELAPLGGREEIEGWLRRAAQAACDFYIEQSPTDGIPYWDTGAPELHRLGDYLDRPAEPFNAHEPVDSSAAAIGVQGLLRLGHYLKSKGDEEAGTRYWQVGLTVLDTLFDEPYLDRTASHHGLILHSVYHRPNGWDYIPEGQSVPCGESSMWGDYHAREVALYVQRIIDGSPYLTFFGAVK